MTREQTTPARRSSASLLLRVGAVIVLIVLANIVIGGAFRALELSIRPEDVANIQRGIWISSLAYALILAMPFVPGVEIGIALLSMFGASVAPLVYFSTILGLFLSFAVGRVIPLRRLAGIALTLRMRRTAALLARIEAEDDDKRLGILMENAPGEWAEWLIRNRYIALAILFNLPGTALIGGGGGIALVAGLSRVFRPSSFLLTVCIAVCPVPLAVYLFGVETILPGK